ncbi:MAG: Flp pilus assembly complex ATPase component TadA [Candidatus Nanohaloarchaeota archaeon QJJ-9]|nr:Flp pilus assembly complex ATPase component TadA [Candidatus Nanohaloarchaeota archaeon QJJ-9]
MVFESLKEKLENITGSEEEGTAETLFNLKSGSQNVVALPEDEDIREVDTRYSLIEPFADAHIKWDEDEESLVYYVDEPSLNEREQEIFDRIKDALEEKIDISLEKLDSTEKIINYLDEKIDEVTAELGIRLSEEEKNKIMYFVYRNFAGLNEIEPLMHDPYIEDIGCSGIGIPVYIVHSKFGSIKTDLKYNSEEELKNLVVKLAERCGKYISYAEPLLDGALPDGSRVNASLTQDVTTKGPTFSIRKFQETPYSAADIIELGTANYDIMAYLWLALEYRKSILISGGTATGKCVAPDDKIHLGNGNIVEAEALHEEVKEERTPKELVTMKKDLELENKQVNKFYRLENNNPVYRIETQRGAEVTVTPEHPFITNQKGDIEKIDAENLEEGAFIASPRKLDPNTEVQTLKPLAHDIEAYASGAQHLVRDLLEEREENVTELAEELDEHPKTVSCWKENNSIPWQTLEKLVEEGSISQEEAMEEIEGMAGMHSSIAVDVPEKVTPELAKVVGYILADGNLDSNYVHFHNTDSDLREDFQESLRKSFGVEGRLRDYDRIPRITVSSKPVNQMLQHFFDIPADKPKARHAETPDQILKSPPEITSSYLQALFDCEADVSNKQTEITFNTSSEALAHEVTNLLHRHGIVARKRVKEVGGEKYYRIVISGKSQNQRFLEEIGFVSKDKERKARENIREADKDHTNTDLVPASSLLKDIKQKEGLTNKEIADKAGVSRRMIGRVLNEERRPSKSTIEKLADNLEVETADRSLEKLKELAKDEVFWDRVDSIEKIPAEESPDYVYDVTVDSSHNFAAGSLPLFIHNTTFLNSVVTFIPPEQKIVSIEDTRELQLPHENWIPSVARSGFGIQGQEEGEVTMYKLLKESFRQNPDYVVVGEVRGKEASVLFQGMSSGHPSLGTMHASSPGDVVKRLTTPPINLSPSLVDTLDIIVIMSHAREQGENARRVEAIYEVETITPEGSPRTNEYFSWTPVDDTFAVKSDSTLLEEIRQQYGLSQKEMEEEVENRKRVLKWMKEQGHSSFSEVARIVSEYYKNPESVIKAVEEDTKSSLGDLIEESESELKPVEKKLPADIQKAEEELRKGSKESEAAKKVEKQRETSSSEEKDLSDEDMFEAEEIEENPFKED